MSYLVSFQQLRPIVCQNHRIQHEKLHTSLYSASSSPSIIPTRTSNSQSSAYNTFIRFLKRHFLPSGDLTPDYYTYTVWRLIQRLNTAICSVFSTQALLLALGFNGKSLGISAATMWVLKDALGKVTRVLWAGAHGRKFDSDAKKWRFRSSLLYALGNGLEVLTVVMPSMFLVIAALANSMKQISILTFSATRNAMYVYILM